MLRRFVLAVLLLSTVPAGFDCGACLWDRDTLVMERQRFPTALELITGKFLRHSADFYRWRVDDRRKRIEAEPSPELYDDLAVAYEKMGNTEQAIRVIEKKAALYPGLYSTHANLGTFLFHSGEYELGLAEIDKALAINPDAHFGREIYQELLVEYLLSVTQGSQLSLPLSKKGTSGMGPVGFGAFLVANEGGSVAAVDAREVIDGAIAGVLGMMKFGNYDSPVLLEALGDLLVSRGFDFDAKQLAARAYLKASYEVQEKTVQQVYRDKAKSCLKFQTRENGGEGEFTLAELESQFQSELNEANVWYEIIKKKEKEWVTAGGNVEQAFESEYYEPPVVGAPSGSNESDSVWLPVSGVLCAVLVAVSFARVRQRKKATPREE